MPAGALHSQRDDGWTKHFIPDQFFRSCSIWMVRRDLLVARSRDMVSCPTFWDGQQPLRSRAEPFGLQSLDRPFNFEGYGIEPAAGICFLVPQGSAHMPDKESRGHSGVSRRPRWPPGSGPTSIWASQEFKSLEGLQGGLRGAAYLCQIGDSDHMRPLSIFSNLENVCKSIHRGWPNLVSTVIDHSPTLSYTGPLQKTCPCVKTHKAMRGTSSDGLFLSQSATSLSSKFWKQCFSGLGTANSLREGETCWNSVSHSIEPQQQEELSTSDLSGFITQYSLHSLERRERSPGTFWRISSWEKIPNCSTKRRSGGGFTQDYGPICTMECWQPVPYSPGYDVGTRTSRKRSMEEEHFVKVDERDIHELQKSPWFQVNRGELAMAMAVVRCCWMVETDPNGW